MVNQQYGHALSTVFGSNEKGVLRYYDEDDDPVINYLRFVDYRYIRVSFHPLKDQFVLSNSWKDPNWNSVRSIRTGLDGDEKDYRERVFGKNLIAIQEKSIAELLVDEVCCYSSPSLIKLLIKIGFPSFLCVPGCQLDPMVTGPVLLLCIVHIHYFGGQHHDHVDRDTLSESNSALI